MPRSLVTAVVVVVVNLAVSADAQWLKDKTQGLPRDKDGKPLLDAPAPRGPGGTPDISGLRRIDPGGYLENIGSDLEPGDVLPWAEALFNPNPTWAGYSVGRWDGDTFVVSSAGFNSLTWLDYGGHPHTDALRVTECFRRKTIGEMELRIAFDEPKA